MSSPGTIGRMSRLRGLWAGVAMIVVALNLRPAIVAVSPLLNSIRATTGLSSAGSGLLATLPVLCFGAFAPFAPRVARRVGMEASLFGVLLLLVAGIALRLDGSVAALFLGTFLAGVAIAIGNVLLPGLIKRDFPEKAGLMTGLYSMALFGGAALAAGVTVPVQHAASLGWRPALAMWGVLVIIAIVCWTPQLRTGGRAAAATGGAHAVRGLWREGLAWQIALFMGLQSLNYYALASWLPTIFNDHGMSTGRAGWMLSFSSMCGIVAALVGPILAGRSRRQGWLTVITGVFLAAGVIGLIVAPVGGAYLWAALLGLGQGLAISVSLTMIVLRAPDTQHAAQLSSMAQSSGYLLASVGPFTLGVLHGATGGWTVPLIVVAVLLAPQTVFGVLAGRDRMVGGYARERANGVPGQGRPEPDEAGVRRDAASSGEGTPVV
jgi:CP family cyanate transporter-like MFS transporter